MFNYCPPREIPKIESQTFPDGKRYYVTPEGKKLPSVTTVVGAQKKQAIMEWRRRVGEEVVVMPDAKEMFISIKPFLNKINNIHYQEVGLWSSQLGLAGRVDCIGEYEGRLSVIDFKTSKKAKDRESILDYFWQCTAYALMYEELIGQPIDELVIIMAVQDSAPLIFKEKTQDHIEGLVKAIDYYHKNS